MQGHLAISVVERKALSLASEQIGARNELQGKKTTPIRVRQIKEQAFV